MSLDDTESDSDAQDKRANISIRPSNNRDCVRFSLRYANRYGQWHPTTDPVGSIASGDEVSLWCHSMGIGPFANVDQSPAFAIPARQSTTSKICFVDASHSNVLKRPFPQRQVAGEYDAGTLDNQYRHYVESCGEIIAPVLADPSAAEKESRSKTFNVSPNLEMRGGIIPAPFAVSSSESKWKASSMNAHAEHQNGRTPQQAQEFAEKPDRILFKGPIPRFTVVFG